MTGFSLPYGVGFPCDAQRITASIALSGEEFPAAGHISHLQTRPGPAVVSNVQSPYITENLSIQIARIVSGNIPDLSL